MNATDDKDRELPEVLTGDRTRIQEGGTGLRPKWPLRAAYVAVGVALFGILVHIAMRVNAVRVVQTTGQPQVSTEEANRAVADNEAKLLATRYSSALQSIADCSSPGIPLTEGPDASERLAECHRRSTRALKAL